MEDTKICTKCKEEKGLEEFSKEKKGKYGRAASCKSCFKAYREANKEKAKAKEKAWREANKEKVKASKKAYREANREKIKASNKAYREANKEKEAARIRLYRKNRYATDEHFRMMRILRRAMQRWKLGSTVDMIGISFEEFKELYGTGSGKHLDHRIPLSWFDIDNADHNKVCQHHTNLQWLTPEENLSKGCRHADINGSKVLREDFNLEAYVQDQLLIIG